jgi:Zn-dependent protease
MLFDREIQGVHETDPSSRGVTEGEYIPPERPSSNDRWKGLGAGAVGLGLLFAKFKSLLLVLLNLKWFLVGGKLFLSSFGFFASVWFYALFWGWKFALIFVVLILVHELGHAAVARFSGISASLPYFIPGLGAFTKIAAHPVSPVADASIALAGPLVGTLGALVCYAIGETTGAQIWTAAAYTGFFLNLFNLAPLGPLDGARVAAAVSPRLWVFGLVALIVAAIAFHFFSPLMLILIVFSIPQAVAAWQGRHDANFDALNDSQRVTIALAYFGLAGFLFAAMLATRVTVPH